MFCVSLYNMSACWLTVTWNEHQYCWFPAMFCCCCDEIAFQRQYNGLHYSNSLPAHITLLLFQWRTHTQKYSKTETRFDISHYLEVCCCLCSIIHKAGTKCDILKWKIWTFNLWFVAVDEKRYERESRPRCRLEALLWYTPTHTDADLNVDVLHG